MDSGDGNFWVITTRPYHSGFLYAVSDIIDILLGFGIMNYSRLILRNG